MLPPWLRRPTALTCASLACAVAWGGLAPAASALAADPSPSTSSSEMNAPADDMAAGLAPLLAVVDEARVQRLKADTKYAEAMSAVTRAESKVNSDKGAVAEAREIVGAYARAAYQSGPTDLTFLAGLLEADSPVELMRRADTAERVGSHKDTAYDAAQAVLAKAQQALDQATADRDRASAAVQRAAAAEADALAEVTSYTSEWADQLAAGLGGATDQDVANSDAAAAWAEWLDRPQLQGAPTVTVAMVRTGKDLPDGVSVRRSTPGVAFWNPDAKGRKDRAAKGRDSRESEVLLLPDRTVQMATYAVSRLGAAYAWRKNTHDAMDCSALVDRAWEVPAAGADAATADRPSVVDGVPGLAEGMRLVTVEEVLPGDVVFYLDGDHGVNHAGVAVTPETMIASDPLTGGVNAVAIDGDRVWRVGRPAAKPTKASVPPATGQAYQCGADPDDLAQLSPAGQWIFPTDDEDWRAERVNPGTEPGMRVHPVLGYARCHDGWDTGDAAGDPIYAVADGVVIQSPNNGGAGNMVTINHGGGVETIYMHLSAFAPGTNGTVVRRGQLIGRVGTTGLSSGPHLHFQAMVDGQPVDPRHFFYGDPITPACG